MLHGCTQNPDDFATGTRANRWAEDKRCLVVYPEQIQRANSHRCWNWFRPLDQQAGLGEPAIIAGIVRQVIDEYQVDARRVYVAGLSAGGAMAAIMAREYPELFAAVGVHSGLPAGAAHDVSSAFAVMKSGQAGFASAVGRDHRGCPRGAADRATRRCRSDGQPRQRRPAGSERRRNTAAAESGFAAAAERAYDSMPRQRSHAVRRTRYVASNGVSIIEHWLIHGAGHAWSGGDSAGSFADARGPDATAVMLDFFDAARRAR